MYACSKLDIDNIYIYDYLCTLIMNDNGIFGV